MLMIIPMRPDRPQRQAPIETTEQLMDAPSWPGFFSALRQLWLGHSPYFKYLLALSSTVRQLQRGSVVPIPGLIHVQKGDYVDLVMETMIFHPHPTDLTSHGVPRIIGLFVTNYAGLALGQDFQISGGANLLPTDDGIGLEAFCTGILGRMGNDSLEYIYSIPEPDQPRPTPPPPTLRLRDQPLLRFPNVPKMRVRAIKDSSFRIFVVLDLLDTFEAVETEAEEVADG